MNQLLSFYYGKPLEKLPRDLQPIATAYIPTWNELTPKERAERAIEVDRQRGLKSQLKYERAERAKRDPVQESIGWHDATLEAAHWASLGDISPIDAAMLHCRFNPNKTSFDDARLITTDELKPEHLVRLAQRFADIDKAEHKPRTLRDWHQTARGMGLTYHSWIDAYLEATAPPPAGPVSAPAKNATPAPVDANGKKWTPENLAALKAYRETHTMAETAAHFQISAQRIRILLPSMKPAKKGYSAFTHHIK